MFVMAFILTCGVLLLLLCEGEKATVDETQTPNRVDQHMKKGINSQIQKNGNKWTIYTRSIYMSTITNI